MRIESARLHRVQIPFRGSFGHALSERSRSDAVFVELRDEQGRRGWGEILPREYVTGETIEGVLERAGPGQLSRLVGTDLSGRAAVEAWIRDMLARVGRDLATLAGVELALLDLAGHHMGFPLAEVLGGDPGPSLPAGVIIGFEVKTEALKKHCIGLRWKGHSHIKVKVGLPDDEDRLQMIAKVFGPDVPLRLDANTSWSGRAAGAVEEELFTLRRVGVPIHSIEQPVPVDDLDGMRRLSGGKVPVMADESVCSLDDAQMLVRERAANIFNVRVGKHGGVLGAQAIVECAQAAGIGVHLGTLVGESGVLSRVAEVFGRCVPGFACLDGKGQNRFLLEEDILKTNSVDADNPAISTGLDAPGLGVEVDPEAVERLSVGPPVTREASAV